jgi:hypothetical protein
VRITAIATKNAELTIIEVAHLFSLHFFASVAFESSSGAFSLFVQLFFFQDWNFPLGGTFLAHSRILCVPHHPNTTLFCLRIFGFLGDLNPSFLDEQSGNSLLRNLGERIKAIHGEKKRKKKVAPSHFFLFLSKLCLSRCI